MFEMRSFEFVVKFADGRREFCSVDAPSVEQAVTHAKNVWCGWDEVVCTGSKGAAEKPMVVFG